MADYMINRDGDGVYHRPTKKWIPDASGNADWIEYQRWISEESGVADTYVALDPTDV